MKSKFILIGAVLFAIATTILFSNYLRSLDNRYKKDKSLVQVVVFKQDVKKDRKVTGDMIETKSYSLNSVLPGTIKNADDIIGSYTLIDMKAGEMLYPDRFTNQAKEDKVLTRKITEGDRAISIAVNYVQSVSSMIEPEDHVDVIASVKNPANQLYGTITILQNARVLAVGDNLTESQNNSTSANTKNTTNGTQGKYSSITLELNPKQAEEITNYEENGDLNFILRSSLEQN